MDWYRQSGVMGGGGGEWAIPAMYGQVEEGERLLVEAIVEASNQ